MTIIDVSIIVGAIALLHSATDFKQARRSVAIDRAYHQRECARHEKNGTVWLGAPKEWCEPPRYGVARRWWEKKTYAEIMDEFNSRSLKDKPNEK